MLIQEGKSYRRYDGLVVTPEWNQSNDFWEANGITYNRLGSACSSNGGYDLVEEVPEPMDIGLEVVPDREGLINDALWLTCIKNDLELKLDKAEDDLYNLKATLARVQESNRVFCSRISATEEERDALLTQVARVYTPGQILNTPAEAMQALLDGQILDQGYKPFHMREGGSFYFLNEDDPLCVKLSSKNMDTTYIYTPPKKKVKTERWFAIYEGSTGSVLWSEGHNSEKQAQELYPNALAYHCVSLDVEVGQ